MHESGEDSGELIFAACRLKSMRKTRMPVAPCMERALGYCGSRRLVIFATTRFGLVHWTDGVDDGLSVVAVWDHFVNHPLIHPHIRGCHFQARAIAPEELTMFASSTEALRVELEELGDGILLDRKKRVVWVGFLAQAFLYLDVAVASEDLPDDDEEDDDDWVHSCSTLKDCFDCIRSIAADLARFVNIRVPIAQEHGRLCTHSRAHDLQRRR